MIKTPTREQLEKLAKVAKVDLVENLHPEMTESGVSIWVDKSSKLITDWQPHKDRNQIAMILMGLNKSQRMYYQINRKAFWLDQSNKIDVQEFGVWMQTVHPSISCEQILKVLEG